MKENYLKILLLALIAIVAVQGYFLYDINRVLNEKQIPVKVTESFVFPDSEPFIEIEKLRHEMQKSFTNYEDFFKTVPSLSKFYHKLHRTPNFDMKEKNGKYIITLEVPGIDKSAIKIEIQNSRLSVRANVVEEKDDNTTTYFKRERRSSSYKHVILLPSDADEESLKSEYKNGLLTITLDKKTP